jgi:hypothetical protein
MRTDKSCPPVIMMVLLILQLIYFDFKGRLLMPVICNMLQLLLHTVKLLGQFHQLFFRQRTKIFVRNLQTLAPGNFGDHPSISLAFVISGFLCFGSSLGSGW